MKKFNGRFGLDEVSRVRDELIADGYTLHINEGSLLDDYILVSPDTRPSWLFKETYLNCWSSAYTVIRLAKKDINKALQGLI